ncbi:9536_t:CDS:10 [Acaulospora morrowiae]|uniref:9536_t:CDS:1 n=1 Tax=Acaulospora morrowiae TaxID=94023 RepID=A0A9N8UZD6_9GLOM|nr:9536_t:CDS:10 [Acaulospora morrowiae]
MGEKEEPQYLITEKNEFTPIHDEEGSSYIIQYERDTVEDLKVSDLFHSQHRRISKVYRGRWAYFSYIVRAFNYIGIAIYLDWTIFIRHPVNFLMITIIFTFSIVVLLAAGIYLLIKDQITKTNKPYDYWSSKKEYIDYWKEFNEYGEFKRCGKNHYFKDIRPKCDKCDKYDGEDRYSYLYKGMIEMKSFEKKIASIEKKVIENGLKSSEKLVENDTNLSQKAAENGPNANEKAAEFSEKFKEELNSLRCNKSIKIGIELLDRSDPAKKNEWLDTLEDGIIELACCCEILEQYLSDKNLERLKKKIDVSLKGLKNGIYVYQKNSEQYLLYLKDLRNLNNKIEGFRKRTLNEFKEEDEEHIKKQKKEVDVSHQGLKKEIENDTKINTQNSSHSKYLKMLKEKNHDCLENLKKIIDNPELELDEHPKYGRNGTELLDAKILDRLETEINGFLEKYVNKKKSISLEYGNKEKLTNLEHENMDDPKEIKNKICAQLKREIAKLNENFKIMRDGMELLDDEYFEDFERKMSGRCKIIEDEEKLGDEKQDDGHVKGLKDISNANIVYKRKNELIDDIHENINDLKKAYRSCSCKKGQDHKVECSKLEDMNEIKEYLKNTKEITDMLKEYDEEYRKVDNKGKQSEPKDDKESNELADDEKLKNLEANINKQFNSRRHLSTNQSNFTERTHAFEMETLGEIKEYIREIVEYNELHINYVIKKIDSDLRFTSISELNTDDGGSFCGMFYNKEKNFIAVVFKGTTPDNYGEWLSNLTFQSVDARSYLFGQVHRGFYNYLFPMDGRRYAQTSRNFPYKRIIYTIKAKADEIRSYWNKKGLDRKVNLWITGHSLGGGLATLFYARLLKVELDILKDVCELRDTVTFASPAVGDSHFAVELNFCINKLSENYPPLWRFVLKRDIVPKLPYRAFRKGMRKYGYHSNVLMNYFQVGEKVVFHLRESGSSWFRKSDKAEEPEYNHELVKYNYDPTDIESYLSKHNDLDAHKSFVEKIIKRLNSFAVWDFIEQHGTDGYIEALSAYREHNLGKKIVE